ncbi:MAG TPA: four helix bundle protein [Puia sp.]|nr:four helix bundle protein [Puia sp.]
MGDYKDLIVYQKAYALAMEVFEISKIFPKEERFSLTDQIRRASRSVCANLGEAYRKRKYKAHFLLKLSDSETENTENQIWLDFSNSCKYLSNETYQGLSTKNSEVGKMIWYMMNNPDKFL